MVMSDVSANGHAKMILSERNHSVEALVFPFLSRQPGSALPRFLSALLVVPHNPSDGLPVATAVAAA